MSLPIIPETGAQTPAATKPRRSRASAKDAGTRFERSVADFLASRLNDDRIDRRAKTGSKDRGDVGGVRTPSGARVVIECKDTARPDLPGWLRQAETERVNDGAAVGVVVHKKRGTADPAEQYVTMSLETLAVLLEGGAK